MGLYSPDVIWHLKNTAKLKVKVTQSCPTLCPTHGLYNPWNSPGQNTGVGSLSLFQGIFPTQGSNPGLPHYRWILYPLSYKGSSCSFNSVQSLSHVWLFATPWIAACQASLSITNSQSLLKFMSITSVMPSNRFILCRPLLLLPSIFPCIRILSNESVLESGGQSIGVSASTLLLPMNIQDLFLLGWTGWVSSLTPQFKTVISSALKPSLQSNYHIHTCLLGKPQFWLDRPLLVR